MADSREELDEWRKKHRISATSPDPTTTSAADASRDPATGLTKESVWRDAFGPKEQAHPYDPAAQIQSQRQATQAGVPGPLSGDNSGVGTVMSGSAGFQGHTIDPYTHQPISTTGDSQGGFTESPSPQEGSDIAWRYAPVNPATGEKDPVASIRHDPPTAPAVPNTGTLPNASLAAEMAMYGAAGLGAMNPYAVIAGTDLAGSAPAVPAAPPPAAPTVSSMKGYDQDQLAALSAAALAEPAPWPGKISPYSDANPMTAEQGLGTDPAGEITQPGTPAFNADFNSGIPFTKPKKVPLHPFRDAWRAWNATPLIATQ